MIIKEDIKNAFINNKNLILISAIIFLVTLLLGYFQEHLLYSYLNPAVETLKEGVQNGVIEVTFKTIFLNNIFIVFRLFIYGVLLCFSNILLAYNGLFLGFFIAQAGNLIATVLLILPHGIFEIPSIIIANASGMTLFKYFYKVASYKADEGELIVDNSLFNRFYKNSHILKDALILLVFAAILIAIAGFIEVYITQDLAFFIMNLIGIK